MGCHTWFYRRCNQEELNSIKKCNIDHNISEYNLWESAINGEYHNIPFDNIACYAGILYHRSDYKTLEEYAEAVYDALYTEYFDTVSGVDEFIEKHPDYLIIDYDSLSDSDKESLDLTIINENGWNNFLELQKYLKKYHALSFSEFCVVMRNMFKETLETFDLDNPLEWTEKDTYNVLKAMSENEHHFCMNLYDSTEIVKFDNGFLYTNKDMPGDVFRIHDYDAPTFYNKYELIDWVNNWKKENNEELLTEEQIKEIHETFDKYNDDVVVDFG